MTNLRTGLGVLAATAAITAAGVGTAAAATHSSHGHGHAAVPCALQQAQVDKAQAKLDVLTAKFAATQKIIKADKTKVAATKGSAKGRAMKALARAKAHKIEVAKAKKAQVQRLAHATARLQKCEAGLTTASPSESASSVPSTSATMTASAIS